jgi:hypothetical protein
MLDMPDDFAAAAEELRALLAFDSAADVVDDFINLVERLPIASKAQASKLAARTKALAAVAVAVTHYQIAFTHVNARRANAGGDFLRQFRDLKKWPTKRRLLNILERDKDENDLRPAESAIRFAILRRGTFGNDIPLDWIERLGDSRRLLRQVAETVCDHFAYKVDRRGRRGKMPLDAYADRLAQIYEELTGRPITYAKATYNSPGRKPGEPYGRGLDFMQTGLRLIDLACTPYQAAAQIERTRTLRLAVAD